MRQLRDKVVVDVVLLAVVVVRGGSRYGSRRSKRW